MDETVTILLREIETLKFSHKLIERELAYQEKEVLPMLRAKLDKLTYALIDIVKECPDPKTPYGQVIVEIARNALDGYISEHD